MAQKSARKTPRSAPRPTRRAPRPARSASRTSRPARRAPRPAKYVYFFGNGKADGDRTMKDLLGGKGSGLAEMTNAGLPVPPDSRSLPRPAPVLPGEAETPAQVDAQMVDNLRKLEKAVRGHARRCQEPAARVGAFRRQVLDAGHDGHDPQPRPERSRPSRASRSAPRTAALPGTAIAASFRCSATSCSRSPKTHSSTCWTR